jgi:hypothetical protein
VPGRLVGVVILASVEAVVLLTAFAAMLLLAVLVSCLAHRTILSTAMVTALLAKLVVGVDWPQALLVITVGAAGAAATATLWRHSDQTT